VKTLLTALREDFPAHQALALELEKLVERPAQRSEYLRLMATGHQTAGRLGEALTAYLQLADLAAEEGLAGGPASLPQVQLDDQGSARLDRWLSARLESLGQTLDAAVQRQLAAAVTARRERSLERTAAEQQLFLAFFGFHSASAVARARLAEHLAGDDRALEAELLIGEMAELHSVSAAATTAARIAQHFQEQGQQDLALHFYRLLRDRWPEIVMEDGRTGSELWAEQVRKGTLGAADEPPASYPWGKVEVTSTTGRPDNLYRRVIPIPVRAVSGQGSERLAISYDGSGASAILVHNGRGEAVGRVALEDGRPYLHLDYRVNYAKLRGNLLITVLGDQVVAVDLLRAARGEGDAVRWRDQLARVMPDVSSRRGNDRGIWDRTNPLHRNEPSYYFVKDASGQPIGALGPVTGRGVFVTRSRTLACLDPATGDTLWSRENPGRSVDIFGDESYLFLAGKTDTVATVVSALDGSVLGTRAVPDWDHRWVTRGRLVLAWEMVEGNVRLYLYDPWNAAELWSEIFPVGSRGDLVSDQAVAVLEPGGRFLVRRLSDAPPEIDARLEAEPTLSSIYILPSREDYALVTDGSGGAEDDAVQVREVPGGLPAPLVHGRLYVFARQTGQPRWKVPAVIDNFGLPLFQPTDLPTLWFLRQVSTNQTRRAAAPSDRTSVLCLDKRTGRRLLSEENIRARTTSYEVVAQPADKTVHLHLPGRTLSVRFTDQPIPPEPPAQ
jgi:outer membrane protein assembly factor BamB